MVSKRFRNLKIYNQQPRRERRVCCSHKVVAVGFNTLRYDANVGVLNPPARIKYR